MNKVVYTCITGGYDTLKEPNVVTEGWDYICFCDEKPFYEEDTVWKLIYINRVEDNIRQQRKEKIYNEWIFDSYDFSVWVDGSMVINTNLDDFVETIGESGSDFYLMKHPAQTCIVGEARGILVLKKDTKEVLETQINTYFSEGYPQNSGMVATGVMIRRHTKEIKDFCKAWMDEVNKHSHRDQMSFNYTAWKSKLNYGMMPFKIIYNEFLIRNHSKRKQF